MASIIYNMSKIKRPKRPQKLRRPQKVTNINSITRGYIHAQGGFNALDTVKRRKKK